MPVAINNMMSSSWKENRPTPYTTLEIQESSSDNSTLVIRQIGYPQNESPLYTITTSWNGRYMKIYTGTQEPSNVIGEAKFHLMSFGIDMSLRGYQTKMKENALSGNFNISTPFGPLKWVTSKTFRSHLELRNEAGAKIAVLKTDRKKFCSEDKRLEIFVSCDPALVDMIVFSGMAARKRSKENQEVIGQAAGAVAG